jgi:hypothetical protein
MSAFLPPTGDSLREGPEWGSIAFPLLGDLGPLRLAGLAIVLRADANRFREVRGDGRRLRARHRGDPLGRTWPYDRPPIGPTEIANSPVI